MKKWKLAATQAGAAVMAVAGVVVTTASIYVTDAGAATAGTGVTTATADSAAMCTAINAWAPTAAADIARKAQMKTASGC